MSWTLPSDAVLQPSDADTLSDAGQFGREIAYKGPYTSLQTALKALAVGDTIVSGYVLRSASLRRAPAGLGVLTLSMVPGGDDESESGEVSVGSLTKDTWHIKSSRNDVSIYGYCNGSTVSGSEGANRADIEMWRAEKDPTLYRDNKFKDDSGTEYALNSQASLIAEKIKLGIEAVIRFTPVVSRSRIYSGRPPACLENLGEINTPPLVSSGSSSSEWSSIKTMAPVGLAAALDGWEWLKVQDDADENGDGTWTRTESWLGAEHWDENLYGATGSKSKRWPMPFDSTVTS